MWPIGPAMPQVQPPGAKKPTTSRNAQIAAPTHSAIRTLYADRTEAGRPAVATPPPLVFLRSRVRARLGMDVSSAGQSPPSVAPRRAIMQAMFCRRVERRSGRLVGEAGTQRAE